jgi:uncharacterized membrane protein HdeD (DUF308 family)
MPIALLRNWWLLALRGLAAIVFAAAALAWLDVDLGEFVLLFGTYAFVDGVAAVVLAFRATDRFRERWPLLAEGAVSAALGVVAWVYPFISLKLLYVLAAWGILTGILEIGGAAVLALETASRLLLRLAGASSILLGAILMLLPAAVEAEVVRTVAVCVGAFGAILVALAVRLRGRRAIAHAPANPDPSHART